MKFGGGLKVNAVWANNGVRISSVGQTGDLADHALLREHYYGIGIEWDLANVTAEGSYFPDHYNIDVINDLEGKGNWGADASLTQFCSGMGSDKELHFTTLNDSGCAYPNTDSFSYIIDAVFDYSEAVEREELTIEW
eukprot:CAMPEP_0170499254 /NCGR_PEP_ID=MMETSP0208-20121228/30749_1 /TAXON_ID=197538 /ORGANISM="Strombidium inclinatum, Strain S3" /LENGTH=136 /DNA_ID=CAMNT_0010776743 /DNA_START=334 /DNA_END=741 /DNA_ORIENTATION=+